MHASEHAVRDRPVEGQAPGGPTAYEQVDACDLCGSADAGAVVSDAIARRRTILCTRCGLLYASPRLSREGLAHYYDTEFRSDAGSNARLTEGVVLEKRLARDDRLASEWSLPKIKRYLDPKGATIVNLRCRTGALSAHLVREGATVFSIDSFEANLRIARDERGLSNLLLVPIADLEKLELPEVENVDAIVAMDIHVLAHLYSPRRLFHRAYELLKPGGYLILDEKDILLPARRSDPSVFGSGHAHNYHLTQKTLVAYAISAGFTIAECRVDKRRASSFRHMTLVARKPLSGAQRSEAEAAPDRSADAAYVARRLRWLERTWRLRQASVRFRRRLRNLSRSARSLWAA